MTCVLVDLSSLFYLSSLSKFKQSIATTNVHIPPPSKSGMYVGLHYSSFMHTPL